MHGLSLDPVTSAIFCVTRTIARRCSSRQDDWWRMVRIVDLVAIVSALTKERLPLGAAVELRSLLPATIFETLGAV